MEKRCFKCELVKPIDDFYRHPMMADGHLGKCKECAKRDARETLALKVATPEGLAAERERGRNKYHRLYVGKPQGRGSAEAKARWIRNNPHKRRAHLAVTNAVNSGKILRPSRCSQCGKKGRIHGHHDDYSKPLAVRWLCSKCHMFLHRKAI